MTKADAELLQRCQEHDGERYLNFEIGQVVSLVNRIGKLRQAMQEAESRMMAFNYIGAALAADDDEAAKWE